MKLTLRELFLLVVIAAMGCGWWVNSIQSAKQNDRMAADLEEWEDRATSMQRFFAGEGWDVTWTRGGYMAFKNPRQEPPQEERPAIESVVRSNIDEPILGMRMIDPDTAIVTTGSMRDSSDARGYEIMLHKKGDLWEIYSRRIWKF